MTKPEHNLTTLGQRLVVLGEALQNPKTSLDVAAGLALQCGLVLHLGLGPKKKPDAESEAKPRRRKVLDK